MKKTFDCVEMKHRGAEKVQAKLAAMTLDEQVAYWERRGTELRKLKADLVARQRCPSTQLRMPLAAPDLSSSVSCYRIWPLGYITPNQAQWGAYWQWRAR